MRVREGGTQTTSSGPGQEDKRRIRRFILDTQLLLVNRTANPSILQRSRLVLRPQEYVDVIEERVIKGSCGYPGCANRSKPKCGLDMVQEYVFLLIKPHVAQDLKLASSVFEHLKDKGVIITERKAKRVKISQKVAELLASQEYHLDHDKPGHKRQIIKELTSGPSVAMLIKLEEGSPTFDPISLLTTLAGPLDPVKARSTEEGRVSLRGRFGVDRGRNVLYCSKDRKTRNKDVRIFFPSVATSFNRTGDTCGTTSVYKLDMRGQVVFDMTEGDPFCSVHCATKSEMFKRSLSQEPFHIRPIAQRVLQRMASNSANKKPPIKLSADAKAKPKTSLVPPSQRVKTKISKKMTEKGKKVPDPTRLVGVGLQVCELRPPNERGGEGKGRRGGQEAGGNQIEGISSDASRPQIESDPTSQTPLTPHKEDRSTTIPGVFTGVLDSTGKIYISGRGEDGGLHEESGSENEGEERNKLEEEQKKEQEEISRWMERLREARWEMFLSSLVTKKTREFVQKLRSGGTQNVAEEKVKTDGDQDVFQLQDRMHHAAALESFIHPHLLKISRCVKGPSDSTRCSYLFNEFLHTIRPQVSLYIYHPGKF
ncbi:hypothetical protein AAMO2058_001439200 [Amorphochlora amoebiformis]